MNGANNNGETRLLKASAFQARDEFKKQPILEGEKDRFICLHGFSKIKTPGFPTCLQIQRA
jgi:hypothetical protein